MCFFDVKGEPISKEEFIKLYNSIYFYLNDYTIEKQIESIYRKGCGAIVDEIIGFLRWKVGDKNVRNLIRGLRRCEHGIWI